MVNHCKYCRKEIPDEIYIGDGETKAINVCSKRCTSLLKITGTDPESLSTEALHAIYWIIKVDKK